MKTRPLLAGVLALLAGCAERPVQHDYSSHPAHPGPAYLHTGQVYNWERHHWGYYVNGVWHDAVGSEAATQEVVNSMEREDAIRRQQEQQDQLHRDLQGIKDAIDDNTIQTMPPR